MKILTNMQSVQAGGIAQSMLSFLQFLKKNNNGDIDLVGIDISRKRSAGQKPTSRRETNNNTTIIYQEIFCRKIHDVLLDITSLNSLENEYRSIIDAFKEIIKKEKPDLIVLNGTYFIPWCFYLAAKTTNIPILLHYHGMITKETEAWDSHSHSLMKQMEQTFDNSRLQYIFPSQLAKKVVEDEIFGHKIARSAILANSIPAHFFEINTPAVSRNIGIVGRWTPVKNPNFVMELAKYNKDNENFFKINVVTDVANISRSDRKRLKSTNIHASMPSVKLGKFYSDMGAIICPSTFESYGNVPQEAVASGTPALVGNNMGIAEVFRRVGLEDFIVDFSSVKDIYDKAKDVSTQRVDNKIRKKMKRELSSETINSELLNIYRQTSG